MRVSMLRVAWVPAAADVLAATDGGGALAAFFNSSKGAFERTRDEFFVCAGCCAASGSSRCSLRATSYDDHGVYVFRSTHLARSAPCAHSLCGGLLRCARGAAASCRVYATDQLRLHKGANTTNKSMKRGWPQPCDPMAEAWEG